MKKIGALILSVFLIQNCFAQHWQALGLGVYQPSTTYMYTDTIYDKLFIGGQYTTVNGNSQRGIATWDGNNWGTLGDGLDSCDLCPTLPSIIWSMVHFNGYLYLGGGFDWVGEIGAKNLAVWDGTNWGMAPGGQPNDVVDDVIVYNNELYICGVFDSVGGVSASGIAKWNGTEWSPIGNNYDFEANGTISKMTFYHGNLYVGGVFQDPQGNTCRLAKWDGATWTFMTNDFFGSLVQIWDFAVYNDELYVSGLFYQAAGNAGNSIVRWNDTTWRDVGGSCEFYFHNVPQVRQMLVHNGKLYCTGNFEIIGGVFAFGLASWDGTNWCGYNTSFVVNSQECGTWNLEFYHDTLYVGGGFYIVEGDTISGIAKWIGGAFVDTCGNTTGIGENNIEEIGVQVFPNPASDVVTFQFENNEQRTIIVYDPLGREVWRKQTSELLVEFPAEEFSDGMYFYAIMQGEARVASDRIVIGD